MSRFAAKHASQLDDSLKDEHYQHGFAFPTDSYTHILQPGLRPGVIEEISSLKAEPDWMRQKRLEAFQHFQAKPTPTWGGDLAAIDYDRIHYYLRPTDQPLKNWEDVPAEIKTTFDKLGIPEAERKYLAGVKMQYDSEVIYGSLKNVWAKDGVIFLSMDEGLAQYPELVREYFGKLIPAGDNKFAALNTAVWSGGSFVYIPKGVHVKLPLQTYFRINAANAGQFERTLIIVDEGASVHYVEGCFVKGTTVETESGPVKIEDIQKGDFVRTHLGRYRQVYHTQVRPYTGRLYTVRLRGDTTQQLQVTAEHPFLVVRRQHANERNTVWEPEWLPISQVKKGDYACIPLNSRGRMLYPRTNPADEKYLYVPIAELQSESVSQLPVYNFSVEEDESYLTAGVAVHNCTAPSFSSASLHSAVVEIFVKKGARCQYTTVQNWYKTVYNLVTKRARVEAEAEMVWTDFNMGSKLTMKYPGFILAGKGARGEVLSMALAGAGQHQDTGAKAIHLAPYTSSTIISKSISKNGGRTSYRGLVHVAPTAIQSKNTVICDALLLDPESRSDTYPTDRILNSQVQVQHEATVSKIGEEQLFYLMSRGVNEETARKMIVNGFIDDVVKKLPLEYAVEMNRLIDHEMEGSIG